MEFYSFKSCLFIYTMFLYCLSVLRTDYYFFLFFFEILLFLTDCWLFCSGSYLLVMGVDFL